MIVINPDNSTQVVYFTPDLEIDTDGVECTFKFTRKLNDEEVQSATYTVTEEKYFAQATISNLNDFKEGGEYEMTVFNGNDEVYKTLVFASTQDIEDGEYKTDKDKKTPNYGTDTKKVMSYD